VEELVESCKMIEQILKNLPDGEIAVKVPRKIIAGEAVSRYEAPRGEDIHFLRTNGTDKPERYKIRAPTLSNIEAAAQSIVGGFVADIPICIAAIDPCFSCTDRAAVILNEKNRGTSIKSWEELRLYGIEWYRSKKGILWK
jgi:NADH-quinone oxidoreductase subunit D